MTTLRRYRVAIVATLVLLVLAVAFHARLLAWFRGERPEGTASAQSVSTVGSWKLATSIEPDPPREKGNRIRVAITDGAAKPVGGATVSVTYDMPAMGSMPEMKSTFSANEAAAGSYEATFDLPMGGSWTIIVVASSGATTATARYTLTVGTKGLTSLGTEGGGATGGAGSATGSDNVAYYTCPMHPSVHAQEPGNCPICSMDLTPVMRSEEHDGMVRVDETRRRELGVRTEKALKAPFAIDIRAVGKLAYDESRLSDVVLKVNGYVSGLRVTAMGMPVRKGQILFQLFSPELFAAQQDYLLARSTRQALGGTSDDLVKAAELKLSLMGLAPDQIQAIAKSGVPVEKLSFVAPASGYVIEKTVVEGAAIKAGDRVFRLAALDKIWVEADVFEADLGRITKGQIATVTLSYIPDRTFEGKVTFIYPYLDPNSRTGRVRLELPNTGLELKPDMFANVTFHVSLGDRIQIPVSAILYTGPRRIVIVDLGGGKLVPREVKIGAQTAERAEVISGLSEGEAVITSGNFLIAAESRIRSSGTFWKEPAR